MDMQVGEESVLLHCPYFPKQSKHSRNSYHNANDILQRTREKQSETLYGNIKETQISK
jgi:hypothetical protein